MKTFKPFHHAPATVFLLLISLSAFSQQTLEHYVAEGLKNNLVIQQKNISLKQAENALRIARNQFLPSIQLLADYTSGDGGRSISLPVGDLLNPVYQSLNQLTQSDRFPQIQNVDENFFPKNFYDAKVRTSLPIINTDLRINRSIKARQLVIMDYELKSYKRQLTYDITEAYFKHLVSAESVRIYEGALQIVEKNVEINQSLKRNGKGLPAQVMRSKSEAEKVKAELNTARNNFSNSQKYFNSLLNRDLDTPVDINYHFEYEPYSDSLLSAAATREELEILKISNEINREGVKMNQLKRLPKVNAFFDLGSQATDWQFNDQSQYYLVGVQLSIPLFQGFSNQLNINQSKLELKKSELVLANAISSTRMSADMALTDLINANENYKAANEQLNAAESYFKLIEKGYSEGVNSLIEFLDARNQLTTSALLKNVRAFDMLIARAKLERETATSSINRHKKLTVDN